MIRIASYLLILLLASCAGRQPTGTAELVHPEYLLSRADRALAAGDLSMAQTLTIQALEADSSSWRAHLLMSRIMLEKGLISAARWEAERAIMLGPNRYQAQSQLGRVLLELPEEPQAFERALPLADSLGAPRRELAILRGEAAIKRLELNQALEHYANLPRDAQTERRIGQIGHALAEPELSPECRQALLQDPLRLGGCACLLVEVGGLEKLLVQSGRRPRSLRPLPQDQAGQMELLAFSGLLSLPENEWLTGRVMSHAELKKLLEAFSLFKQGDEPADSDERLDKVSEIDPDAPRDGSWFLNRLREIP